MAQIFKTVLMYNKKTNARERIRVSQLGNYTGEDWVNLEENPAVKLRDAVTVATNRIESRANDADLGLKIDAGLVEDIEAARVLQTKNRDIFETRMSSGFPQLQHLMAADSAELFRGLTKREICEIASDLFDEDWNQKIVKTKLKNSLKDKVARNLEMFYSEDEINGIESEAGDK